MSKRKKEKELEKEKKKNISKKNTESTKSKKNPKSKKKKNIFSAIVHGKFSFNNTILSLSDNNGNVLKQVSAGSLGYKNTKKSTPYAAQKCVETMSKIIEEDYGISEIEVHSKGVGPGRDVVIRKILENNNFQITALIDKTPIAFGGCRPPKIRKK